jgi:hypothetical protein
MVTTPQKLTASETVLLAAANLAAAGNEEFTEWDLTVAAWTLDRLRFGLRGYAQSYPDHKRVMMEIMGQKPSSPVQQKFLEKLRPNYYRLTPLGKAVAARLRSGGSIPAKPATPATAKPTVKTEKPEITNDLYSRVVAHLGKPEFKRWQDNPEEPRNWAGAATFLGLTPKDANPAEKLEEIRAVIQEAVNWCTAQEVAYLTRGAGQGGTPIHVSELANMLDFLQALIYRFPEALEKKSGPKGGSGGSRHKSRLTD